MTWLRISKRFDGVPILSQSPLPERVNPLESEAADRRVWAAREERHDRLARLEYGARLGDVAVSWDPERIVSGRRQDEPVGEAATDRCEEDSLADDAGLSR